MNKPELLKKLKRKPKWKLEEERNEIDLEQKKLRLETDAYRNELSSLQSDEIAAFKANDTESIELLDAKIGNLQKKIEDNEKRYSRNANVLKIYSEAMKNDKEGDAAKRNSIAGSMSAIIGAGLGIFGLYSAYKSDTNGTLINKKTLESVRNLPVIRNIGNLLGKK